MPLDFLLPLLLVLLSALCRLRVFFPLPLKGVVFDFLSFFDTLPSLTLTSMLMASMITHSLMTPTWLSAGQSSLPDARPLFPAPYLTSFLASPGPLNHPSKNTLLSLLLLSDL